MPEFKIGEVWRYEGYTMADTWEGTILSFKRVCEGTKLIVSIKDSDGKILALCYGFVVHNFESGISYVCDIGKWTKLKDLKYKQIKSPFLMGYKIND